MKRNQRSKRLLFVVNVDWIFVSHRLSIAEAALNAGYEVFVASKDTGKANEIRNRGVEFVELSISRSGTNPLKELYLCYELLRLYKNLKPDIVHHTTLKPVIYGSILTRLLKIKTINAISGLGYSFTDGRRGRVQETMITLMRFGFRNPLAHFIFQNQEDFEELLSLNVVSNTTEKTFIKGVGVNLEKYANLPVNKSIVLKVVLPSRMLWDKGVKEFVEAAKILYPEFGSKVRFVLYGKSDKDNPKGVPETYLKSNQIDGFLIWEGYQEDNINMYAGVDIVVLPSYREGMPKVLLEACAAAIPIVTTNAIGCRDCVEEGKNGLKVAVKSIDELALAIKTLIESKSMRQRMGIKGREKALIEFDINGVISKHLELYKQLLHK